MKTIKDIDLNGKIVIIRCDFNVPINDNKITDDSRIFKSLPTLKYVMKYAKKVIILSHLGRVKNEEDKKNNSLKIVCERLSELLDENVILCDVDKVEDGKVILLENVRYFDLDNKKESNNDTELSKYYASLGDVFINDAFGVCHREAASTTGISSLLPSAIGFLVEEEINKLSTLFDAEKPFSIILGGAKVEDKIGIIENLIDKVDNIFIVGAMAFTFMKANGYKIGNSLVDDNRIDYCRNLLEKYGEKIILPVDFYVSNNAESDDINVIDNNIPDGMIGFDIGPKSVNLIKENIINSKTIFVNGPAGLYENDNYKNGTIGIFEILKNIDGKVIIGGGDSASAAKKFGYENDFYHISTGGGASLEFLEGKMLPGLKNIGD